MMATKFKTIIASNKWVIKVKRSSTFQITEIRQPSSFAVRK